ncbi:guanylate kinase [Dolosigranulum pigrum]|uniref:guanylate kinase n=1 Tax=Dolosigranulum pigrum TaxID=29394 RepID=UPI001AD85CF4|nr:AAA family ATPase [Dolosigranulum pigrum]QTJ54366.1 guanylate kinase [Dolosigranulum pigrum]
MGKFIIVLVGPSGSGKTSLGSELTKAGYPKLVTTTTRSKRPGEQEGEDYYFRVASELEADDFVEQTVYNNHMYGLTKAEVQEALAHHDIVHVSLDRNGVHALSRQYPDIAVTCFITISEEEMARRMAKRGDSPRKINERISFCREIGELTPPQETDYVIENNHFRQAVNELLAMIDQLK